ncbi:hypothetical protein PPYR_14645 [Photinus pyralis]|uniref:Uncharacterized protein n=1 Tax=Photinus pyralis TaxID=7054 RepID=A0A1Y1L9Y7_PHOPY|nr:uncharacterized protein LOC116181034 [Photinus pyralis]XP_031357267.1 uncharacterized protein LOC116181130 [Photinus pyralis]KAB0792686.1 hypothetical protein PPYR_14645 [Photinus pyralis]
MLLKVLLIVVVAVHESSSFTSSSSMQEVFVAWRERTKDDSPRCQSSSGATAQEVDGFWQRYEFPKTKSFQCYLTCLMKAFDFLSVGGNLEGEKLVEGVEKITNSASDYCMEKTRGITDECQKVSEYAFCVVHSTTAFHN